MEELNTRWFNSANGLNDLTIMKKSLILAAIIAVVCVGSAVAQPRAIGVNLGTGNGLSYQHCIGESNMLDVSVSLPITLIAGQSIGLGGLVTYDWINPFGTAIPWNYEGQWNWYLGIGASAGAYALFNPNYYTSWYAGAAAHVGMEYQFSFPLQLSFDYRPTIGFVDMGNGTVGFGYDGFYTGITIGVRYLF